MTIVFKVSVYDSTTNDPIFGATVTETVKWGGGMYVLEAQGSRTFTGQTDGNGNYEISLSDIGLGDSPYSITGKVAANGYLGTNFAYAAITGNADGHTITKTVYLTPNVSNPLGPPPGPNNPLDLYNNLFGGTSNVKKTVSSSMPIIIWIIALVIIIAVVALFFVLRGKGAGPSKPKAVIY